MLRRIEERLGELARRAGLRGVPPAALRAAALLFALAVAAALVRWWPRGAGGGEVFSAGGARSAETSVASGAAASGETSGGVLVHVVGAVRRPGVYTVASGGRVADAVALAGGMLGNADAAGINLARVVADGEQIRVPVQGEAAASAPGGAGGAPGAGPAGGPVDINTADVALLDTLPGVGPSTAQRIVADREANGPYRTVEDLGRVSGIGDKRLEQLKGLIVVR